MVLLAWKRVHAPWAWTGRRSPPAAPSHIDVRICGGLVGGVRSGVDGTPGLYLDGYLVLRDCDELARAIVRVLAQQR